MRQDFELGFLPRGPDLAQDLGLPALVLDIEVAQEALPLPLAHVEDPAVEGIDVEVDVVGELPRHVRRDPGDPGHERFAGAPTYLPASASAASCDALTTFSIMAMGSRIWNRLRPSPNVTA